MRAVRLLPVGLALWAGVLGCSAINYTAGVCDCNPPAVESVLAPPVRPYSAIGAQMPTTPGHPHADPYGTAPVNKLSPPSQVPANPPAGHLPDKVPPLESVPNQP